MARLTALPILLFMLMAKSPLADEITSVPTTLREEIVCEIPVGSDRGTQVSPLTCEECGEGACFAGIGAVDEVGSAYFYDLPNDNIKVCMGGEDLKTVPGLKEDQGKPWDMVATDGVIYLLVDRFRHEKRFVVYQRPPDGGWAEITLSGKPGMGELPETLSSKPRTMALNTVWLWVGQPGEVFLLDRTAGESIQLTHGNQVVAESERAVTPGIVGSDGHRYLMQPDHFEALDREPINGDNIEGLVLGVDASGRVYARRTLEGNRTYLSVYEGKRLLAETLQRPVQTEKLMQGKYSIIVGPNGGLYQWLPLKDRLVVRRWVLS